MSLLDSKIYKYCKIQKRENKLFWILKKEKSAKTYLELFAQGHGEEQHFWDPWRRLPAIEQSQRSVSDIFHIQRDNKFFNNIVGELNQFFSPQKPRAEQLPNVAIQGFEDDRGVESSQ